MDVSVNPVLESVRPFFQGLPTNNSPSPVTSVPVPSHPAAATPVQPSQHGFQNNPPSSIPSSSPSVLSYWPGQRAKEPQTSPSPALASPLHHVYNGTKLEPLPPVGSLGYGLDGSQGALLHRHRPLPSISQITPHSAAKTPASSVSPRTTPSQFRAPEYPQSNHRSIYSPNSSSNQSHSRSSSSSSYQSQSQSQALAPAVSSPSPHAYSFSPRSSTPQTTTATSLYVSSSHHRHQGRPHQSHHPMSPVIQQPSQPDIYGHIKLRHSQSNQQLASGPHGHHQSVSQPAHPQPHPQHSPRPPAPAPPPHPHPQARHHGLAGYQQQQPQQQHRPGTVHQQPTQGQGQQPAMASSHQLLAQQHQQLQQQAALYNQSIKQSSRQSEADKQMVDMQQALRLKHRQQQQQPYYPVVPTSNHARAPSQATTTVVTSNPQRTIRTQALSAPHKRESPLDLSVKTVRQSADSTAKDDSESVYLSNFQSHEAFHNRPKPTKMGNQRSPAVLPPLQLPSTVVYPQFENHTSSQPASSGAPKVDFLPNFNTHHSSSLGGSTSFHDTSKRQRKSSTSQLPSQTKYPPQLGNLPHMGSFKKSILSSAAYDDPNKQTQYYPATGPPNVQRSTVSNNHSTLGSQSAFTPTQNNQFSYDLTKRGLSARYDFVDRRNTSEASNESNYSLGKRQSTSDLRHPLPPKIPRVVDTWRQTIDQQIEQRLNSYASSRGHQVNGTTATKESIVNNEALSHQQSSIPYSLPSSSSGSIIQSSHSTTVATGNSLIKSSPLFNSQRSNSNSKLNLHNQYYPHNQGQYNIPQRPIVHETYNDLSQVKLSSLPANGAADKRVLSILRKRLDTREATNQLAQQQLQQQQSHSSHLQDRSKMYSSLPSRPYPQQLIVPSPVPASLSKPPQPPQPQPPQPLGRHNLPPFNALNLERSSVMSYSNKKLHIPKAMDSVVPEHSQALCQTRPDIPPTMVQPHSEVPAKHSSGENGADFDGLAAFLAARIRTKAELKQVGPSVDQQQQQQQWPTTPTPASGSNSSAHSPRTTPGIFSPPPNVQINYPTVPADFGKGTPASESDRASSSGLSSSSPLKSSRDRYGINSPRRRLFYRPEDELGGISEGVILAREGGLRSSSETSVFDFRESDSDGEPNSERQSLNEMRKDRDRRLQEKQHTMPTVSPEPVTEISEIDDSPFVNDSFWGGICDQFVNQLEKGGNKVKKIGRRKKLIYTPLDSTEPFEQYDGYKLETSFIDEATDECERKIYDNDNVHESKIEVHENVIVKSSEIELDNKSKIQLIESEINENEVKNNNSANISIKIENNVPTEDEIPGIGSTSILKQKIKVEEESSDEDVPLSLRQTELKKHKSVIVENIHSDGKDQCSNTSVCDKSWNVAENIKKECEKQDVKKDISESEAESSADESIESVAKRLRMRKNKEDVTENKRITRSSEKENSLTPKKIGRKKKGEKKKSVYGDGSEFRPGWEAEVYRYKRSLRMPARLINIAGPQSWPRLSVSLPDLDPDSPMTLDSDISLQNKKNDSDGECTPTKTKHSALPKCKKSPKPMEEKGEEDSFINRLVQRYGAKGKKSLRKGQDKDCSKERKGPKIIPQTNELTLLPTPSLDCIVKSPMKNSDSNASPSKAGKGKKSNKDSEKSSSYTNSEGVFLGYFRKKTVADFRDAFAKHNGGFATENELPPIMLKSRTRTQTRILTQRATIREVFGEDRPASAPPAGCRDNENEEVVKSFKNDSKTKKNKVWLGKRNNNSNLTIATRSGLRCAFVLRSNKAILKSKQHLLHGGARRKRSKDLIKAFSSKHHQDQEEKKVDRQLSLVIKPLESVIKVEPDISVHPIEKRFKYRSVRRKLKSSGFDYIRKKKKQQQKKDGENEPVKEKKKVVPTKSNLESEEDIQNEIKAWVINKGLGETVLHRAARLGYKDIAAYCLEKMDHNPSPRDNAGYTPLHEACSKGRLEIAKMLLQYGADVSDSAQGGIRPLHEAADNGNLELIRLLLSYGADPLLATYSGHTPLSLTCHNPDARSLMQNHLADVQGLPADCWQLPLTDWSVLGSDPLCDPVLPDPCDCELEVESGELSLPHLYQLLGEPHTDRWVLFQELGPVLRVKTREALIKQLGQAHRHDFRDLKMTDFYDMARCCSVLGVGDYILNPKAHKVTLVKYSDRVRALLNSETFMVTAR